MSDDLDPDLRAYLQSLGLTPEQREQLEERTRELLRSLEDWAGKTMIIGEPEDPDGALRMVEERVRSILYARLDERAVPLERIAELLEDAEAEYCENGCCIYVSVDPAVNEYLKRPVVRHDSGTPPV